MKVEIWSDFISPLCYIGKRKFELALEKFERKEYIQIEFKSFQLNRELCQSNKKLEDFFKEQLQMCPATLEAFKVNIKQHAELLNLPINFEEVKQTNTLDAHRLVKYAEKHGKGLQLIESLFNHYFLQKNNIGQKEMLLTIAKENELNIVEVTNLLSVQKYRKLVEYDEDIAEEIGITEVPFFIFNEKYSLYGDPSVEVILEALRESWKEDEERLLTRQKKPTVTTFCLGDDCEVK